MGGAAAGAWLERRRIPGPGKVFSEVPPREAMSHGPRQPGGATAPAGGKTPGQHGAFVVAVKQERSEGARAGEKGSQEEEPVKKRGWPKGKKRKKILPNGPKAPVTGYRYLDEAEKEKQQYLKELWAYQQSEAYKVCTEKIQESKIKKEDSGSGLMNTLLNGHKGVDCDGFSTFDVPIFTEEFLDQNKAIERDPAQHERLIARVKEILAGRGGV
ncbi:hypothetical protein A6R68_08579 [Neotoma lepida]|uniref:HMG box domain-containing protein n=1 Tax=Neotoma lepida TaxID=56216 RepID=A0A1A6G4P5_NEOLE|nr:hypothetical protein A6R68_08579 [Neotoma lepida]